MAKLANDAPFWAVFEEFGRFLILINLRLGEFCLLVECFLETIGRLLLFLFGHFGLQLPFPQRPKERARLWLDPSEKNIDSCWKLKKFFASFSFCIFGSFSRPGNVEAFESSFCCQIWSSDEPENVLLLSPRSQRSPSYLCGNHSFPRLAFKS